MLRNSPHAWTLTILLTLSACAGKPAARTPASEPIPSLEQLARQESANTNVVLIRDTPTEQTCSSIRYEFPEVRMNPGDAAYFAVPEGISSRSVRFVVLGHRQNPAHPWHAGVNPEDPNAPQDPRPGLTSVQIYVTPDSPGRPHWRYWGGPASGPLGSKFAEPRDHHPEMEGLYDWPHYGSHHVETGKRSKLPVHPKALRVVSIGTDEVYLSELGVKVEPSPATEWVSARFGDYENALILRGKSTAQLPKGWKKTGSRLSIPLPAGKLLRTVEVTCGDKYHDGTKYVPGSAKLNITWVKADGTSEAMMKRENVPPVGTLYADPTSCDLRTQPGDQIVIEAERTKVHVLDVKIGLGN